ncbi:MAG: TonB-dependent receptor [Pseudomonadales bacterium]|nr:TonB-dependent receptor [Pseudomonadales bacterium]
MSSRTIIRQPNTLKPLSLILASFPILASVTTVHAEPVEEQLELTTLKVVSQPQKGPSRSELLVTLPTVKDTAELLKVMPGADVNQNGPLTGIAHYRGYFGDRVNVSINNMHLKPAGPNSMDPPLSHIPAALMESLTLIRGVAPVSSGLETIGGTIIATPKTSEFGSDKQWQQSGDLALGYSQSSQGTQTSLFTSLANRHHRLHLTGSFEQGDDYEYPNGNMIPSEYERTTFGLGYGFQDSSGQQFGIDYHYNDTGLTGTAALPMDIIFASGDIVKLNYSADLNDLGMLEIQLNYEDLEHVMDNVTLRTSMMKRVATTDVNGIGFKAVLTTKTPNGETKLGVDGDTANHNALITDPTNPMFRVDNFNDVERNRMGLFAEWQENRSDSWSLGAGVRVVQVDMDAGTVSHNMAMMNANIMTLMSRFNSADRSQSDHNIDLVLNTRYPLSNDLELEVSLARKNRSPSYQERFLWIPMQSTGGLADGNNYSGDINLEAENADQLELGLSWNTKNGYLNPRIYYHEINDYIQGVPETDMAAIMVSSMMSTVAPLKFANVDAKIFGFDADWGAQLTPQWQLDGVISYTRGEREDINDHLYRIAPLNGLIALTRINDNWKTSIETQAYARQNKVSSTNNEATTAGYALVNIRVFYSPTPNLSFGAGIENLLDKSYQQHLGGVNRASSNSIPVGTRLYGPGTNFYANANLSW